MMIKGKIERPYIIVFWVDYRTMVHTYQQAEIFNCMCIPRAVIAFAYHDAISKIVEEDMNI